ncbi:amidohydrolase family protein [Microbacterium soli]|uniref:Amidohydrolase family protein n=1 Tax=Microbacterium soli TaxID=446075 RepID=A0ABP7NHP2_9MICO
MNETADVRVLREARMPDGRLADVELQAGRIRSIRPASPRPRTAATAPPRPATAAPRPGTAGTAAPSSGTPGTVRTAGTAGAVIECGGAHLLPGLIDHHIHLLALAAALESVDCSPRAAPDPASLGRALRAAAPDAHGWIRGVGYDESTAGSLDARALDRFGPRGPVRLQHRSGALWILNSAALTRLDPDRAPAGVVERDPAGAPTGRIWRGDEWLRSQLPRSERLPLARVGAELARLGVTEVTDATPGARDAGLIARARASGALPQRVTLLGEPGEVPPEVRLGPRKIVLGDSGLPAVDELVAEIARARAARRAVAVHCVTREALVLLLAALARIGARPGDRVEHAAVVPPELIPMIRDLGLAVVTQPGFLWHRGDRYLAEVDADDTPHLYRHRTLLDAGIPVVASSDAPYGPVNPWTVMHDAVHRRAPGGAVLGPRDRVTAAQALAGYLSPADDLGAVLGIAAALLAPRGRSALIRPGMRADLILTETPALDAIAQGRRDPVILTLVDGRVAAGR